MNRPQFTRWRSIANPVSPLDPIQPDGPRYEEGHIPAGFVVLLWDGKTLLGPRRFESQAEADNFLSLQPTITEYMIVPKPLSL